MSKQIEITNEASLCVERQQRRFALYMIEDNLFLDSVLKGFEYATVSQYDKLTSHIINPSMNEVAQG